MRYIVESDSYPLILEYENDKKIILFIDGKIVKDNKFNCICSFICETLLKIGRYINKHLLILKKKG